LAQSPRRKPQELLQAALVGLLYGRMQLPEQILVPTLKGSCLQGN
jgi:hypothetical protein